MGYRRLDELPSYGFPWKEFFFFLLGFVITFQVVWWIIYGYSWLGRWLTE